MRERKERGMRESSRTAVANVPEEYLKNVYKILEYFSRTSSSKPDDVVVECASEETPQESYVYIAISGIYTADSIYAREELTIESKRIQGRN